VLFHKASVAAALLLASINGCGPAKLNDTRTLNLDGFGDIQVLELDPQPKPQTIRVEFSTSGGEVSVFLYKEEDVRGNEGVVNANPAKAIAKSTKKKEDNISAEVPPNTATRVVIECGSKKTEVKIKITNSK